VHGPPCDPLTSGPVAQEADSLAVLRKNQGLYAQRAYRNCCHYDQLATPIAWRSCRRLQDQLIQPNRAEMVNLYQSLSLNILALLHTLWLLCGVVIT
jgi:hypothetical protein